MEQVASRSDPAERESLKVLALEGAIGGRIKRSCADLAAELDVSTQTVSRRLQALEEGGLLEREHLPDGQLLVITGQGEQVLRAEYEAYRELFEGTTSVELRGLVTDGMGEGRHYISLPGYERQFIEKLGYEPFPGTLNLTLTEESVHRRSGIAALSPIHIEGWEDEDRTYGPADCYPASLRTETGDHYDAAHAIIPERTHHDEDSLELIAPDKLRDVLALSDQDQLRVEIRGR